MHNIKWFTDRIWKRIYREKSSCKCFSCQDVSKNWLIIIDKEHACYLSICQEIHNYRDN